MLNSRLLSLVGSLLLILSTYSDAGELIAPVTNVNQQSGIIDLGLKGQQLGQIKTTYLIPLQLENAPIKASIEMSFVVISTGICPTSYFPTEIFLNNESIAEIDFREMNEGSKQALKVELPMKYQQQGKNTIKIVTGDCNEGLDSLRFNDVGLHIEKTS
ncbi:MAG: hypothetical protein GXP21_08310 [Gammaproteobacteria bacterium]|nr:hypothetical protein [Gammaproteobacteria bacterium]